MATLRPSSSSSSSSYAQPNGGSGNVGRLDSRSAGDEASKTSSQESEGYHSCSQSNERTRGSGDVAREDRPDKSISTVEALTDSRSGDSKSDSAIHGMPVPVQSSTSSAGPSGQRRLHVSNLPFRFRDNDLVRLFEPYGHVAEAEIIFNERGSKGFGFVTFDSGEEADVAKFKVHGSVIDGRKIEVNEATPRTAPKKPKPYPPPAGSMPPGPYRGYLPPPLPHRGGYGSMGYPPAAMAAAAAAQRSMYDPRAYGYPDMGQASYPGYGAYSGYGTQDAYQSGFSHQDYAAQYARYLESSQGGQQQQQQQQQQSQQQSQQPQQQQQGGGGGGGGGSQQGNQQQASSGQDRPAYSSSGYGPIHGYQPHYRYQPY
ncbi:RNA binding protein fox-1 homolog 1-like [Oscarella lobularis]|uniref:RNA binding protein fox-1 homolog 1-like n=1 Tax=Oscarella lobularis TaxID=121494 RepID=UPI0033141197